jgi:uncharacterized protein (DUF1800 family)
MRLVVKAPVKESDIIEKIASIMDRHSPLSEEARKLKVMADLRGSDCLSVGECGAVFQDHTEWERRLVEKAAVKKSDIVEKIASIMDRHSPLSEEARKLKVMADLRGSDCLSVGECGAVFQDHTEWERRLVEKAAVKKSDIVEKIASIMDRHSPLSEEARKLKDTICLQI